jgi:hypothetical protein
MKKISFIFFVLIVLSIFLAACNSDRDLATELYNKRDYILKQFKNKSLISRSKNFYQLAYYQDEHTNEFNFQKIDGIFLIVSDSIEFPMNQSFFLDTFGALDTLESKENVLRDFKELVNLMDSLKVNGVSRKHSHAGIDLKLYFGKSKALLFVSDVNKVTKGPWKDYVLSGEKLSKNWYYVEDK